MGAAHAAGANPPEQDDVVVLLRKLRVINCVLTTRAVFFDSVGLRTEFGDIDFDDFQQQAVRPGAGDEVVVVRSRGSVDGYVGKSGKIVSDARDNQPYQIEGMGANWFFEDEVTLATKAGGDQSLEGVLETIFDKLVDTVVGGNGLPRTGRVSPVFGENAKASPRPASEAPETDGGIFGSIARRVIKSFDKDVLGLSVTLGAVSFNPIRGRIEIDGIWVQNPAGYCSSHMMYADRFCIDVNMGRLLASQGAVLEMNEVFIEGLHIIWERSFSTSNLEQALNPLDPEKEQLLQPTPKAIGNRKQRSLCC